MSRHRGVRHLQDEYDDDYDDGYDDYDDGYDEYDHDHSGYVYQRDEPKKNTPVPVVPSVRTPAKAPATATPVADKETEDLLMTSGLEYIKGVVGGSFKDAAIRDSLGRFNFDAEAALAWLLESGGSWTATPTPVAFSPAPKVQPKVVTQLQHQHPPHSPRLQTPATPKSGAGKKKEEKGGGETNQLAQDMAALGFEVEKGLQTPSGGSQRPTPRTSPQTQKKKKMVDVTEEYKKRKEEEKEKMSLVVVGHVDAGKSTLMGHLLFQLGCVDNRTMNKYERESQKIGKGSFAYAWVLDETGEERSRGITMDIAETSFETPTKRITLLDAPGHRDFIPNMITGAAQADVAVLVVNATTNEFEAGFEAGGQTREHALLVRSLGVTQLIVAVNKLDTVGWSQERYEQIKSKLVPFLKTAGFREKSLVFVPCSGLAGTNLVKKPTEPVLTSWYSGQTLVEAIDALQAPERAVDKPLRMSISDIFKSLASGTSVAGPIHCGHLQPGSKLMLMPGQEVGSIKTLELGDQPARFAVAGDHVTITLQGIDISHVNVGMLLCDPDRPIRTVQRIQAQIVVFNVDVPITRGYQVVVHYQMLNEAGVISKLEALLNKQTGEVEKKRPRVLTKHSTGIVEVTFPRPMCMEEYKEFRDLGRFMLRDKGKTVAAGIVLQCLDAGQ